MENCRCVNENSPEIALCLLNKASVPVSVKNFLQIIFAHGRGIESNKMLIEIGRRRKHQYIYVYNLSGLLSSRNLNYFSKPI